MSRQTESISTRNVANNKPLKNSGISMNGWYFAVSAVETCLNWDWTENNETRFSNGLALAGWNVLTSNIYISVCIYNYYNASLMTKIYYFWNLDFDQAKTIRHWKSQRHYVLKTQ